MTYLMVNCVAGVEVRKETIGLIAWILPKSTSWDFLPSKQFLKCLMIASKVFKIRAIFDAYSNAL